MNLAKRVTIVITMTIVGIVTIVTVVSVVAMMTIVAADGVADSVNSSVSSRLV